MNPTHIHLVITHLPFFGSILGAFVLTYALWTKSDQTKMAAYYLLIISSLGAGIAYLTGEEAEETLENLQGISENTIERHEDFAIFALVALIILGAFSIIGAYLTYKKSPLTRTIAFITLIISLAAFLMVARTGYLGGQIRHSEINSNTVNATESGEEEEEDEN